MNLKVKVITNAKEEEVQLIKEGNIDYKIKVRTVAEKGKANIRVTELLAEELRIKKNTLEIIKGRKSNLKVIKIKEGD